MNGRLAEGEAVSMTMQRSQPGTRPLVGLEHRPDLLALPLHQKETERLGHCDHLPERSSPLVLRDIFQLADDTTIDELAVVGLHRLLWPCEGERFETLVLPPLAQLLDNEVPRQLQELFVLFHNKTVP